MSTQVCRWCAYWHRAQVAEYAGTCQRHAPVVPLHVPAKPDWETWGRWPLTHQYAGCGDWARCSPDEDAKRG